MTAKRDNKTCDDVTGGGEKWIGLARAEGQVSSAAKLTLEARLATVQHFLPLASLMTDQSVEHVHQLRVGTRRVIAAFKLYQDFLPNKESRWIRKRMRQIREVAGVARDLDVLSLRYTQTDPLKHKRLLNRLKRLRRKARRALTRLYRELIETPRLENHTAKLLHSIDGPVELSLPEFARSRLADQCNRFIQSSGRQLDSVGELHRFRIRAKELRYTIELLSDVLPVEVRTNLYPIVCQTQDVLGELNDHSIAAVRLKRLAKNENRTRQAKRLKELARDEKQKIQAAIQHFQQWWTPEFARDLESQIQRALSESPSRT